MSSAFFVAVSLRYALPQAPTHMIPPTDEYSTPEMYSGITAAKTSSGFGSYSTRACAPSVFPLPVRFPCGFCLFQAGEGMLYFGLCDSIDSKRVYISVTAEILPSSNIFRAVSATLADSSEVNFSTELNSLVTMFE